MKESSPGFSSRHHGGKLCGGDFWHADEEGFEKHDNCEEEDEKRDVGYCDIRSRLSFALFVKR